MSDGIDGNTNVTNCMRCKRYMFLPNKNEYCSVGMAKPRSGYVTGFCSSHTEANNRRLTDEVLK